MRLGDLHLLVCKKARPDPAQLGRRLVELELQSDHEAFYEAADRYADVLQQEGLAGYREALEGRWARQGRPEMSVKRTGVIEVPMVLSEDEVDLALDGRNHERAKTGRHAWEALTWTGESPVVPLIDFQEYIWYRLPVKYLTGVDHKLEILGGLERMLDVMGVRAPRGTVRFDSDQTHHP